MNGTGVKPEGARVQWARRRQSVDGYRELADTQMLVRRPRSAFANRRGPPNTVILRNEEPVISAFPHQPGARCRKRSEVLRFAQNDGEGRAYLAFTPSPIKKRSLAQAGPKNRPRIPHLFSRLALRRRILFLPCPPIPSSTSTAIPNTRRSTERCGLRRR